MTIAPLITTTVAALVAISWPSYLMLSATSDGPWWMRIVQPMAPWLFLIGVLLLPAGALLSLPGVALVGALSCALWVWRFAPQLARLCQPAPSHSDSLLTVMTINLLKTNQQIDQVVETILAADAHLVFFQELRPAQARLLAERLNSVYPHQELAPRADYEGMGMVSRLPWHDVETDVLAPGASPSQRATIDIAGLKVALYNVHPRIPRVGLGRSNGNHGLISLDSSARASDLTAIRDWADGLAERTIIAGDLNTTQECYEYRLMDDSWHNAFVEQGRGLGMSYPVGVRFFGVRLLAPAFRIDHLLYRGPMRAVQASTGHIPGSDHRYLRVTLDLNEANREFSSDSTKFI